MIHENELIMLLLSLGVAVYIPAAGTELDKKKVEPDIQKTGTEYLMVVDDETNITDVTARILKGHGYSVTVFNTGRLARI